MRRDERWEQRQFRRNLRWGFGGSWVIGLILMALALMLLLGIDFGKLWPVILILLGLGALFGGWWRPNRPMPPR